MATSNVRQTVIGIVNEVQRKLGVDETANMNSTKLSAVLVDFLNDTIDECGNYGAWPQLFREIDVSVLSSAKSYELAVSADVQSIYEIHFGTQVSPLEVRTIEDLRRLQKLSGGGGQPRQFALVDVSGVNPQFRTYPIAITAQASSNFDVAYYKKIKIYDADTTTDSVITPPLPSRMLVQGVYAKALLEEAGQEPTRQSQKAEGDYIRMRREAHNRWTADTGTDLYVNPMGTNS